MLYPCQKTAIPNAKTGMMPTPLDTMTMHYEGWLVREGRPARAYNKEAANTGRRQLSRMVPLAPGGRSGQFSNNTSLALRYYSCAQENARPQKSIDPHELPKTSTEAGPLAWLLTLLSYHNHLHPSHHQSLLHPSHHHSLRGGGHLAHNCHQAQSRQRLSFSVSSRRCQL